MLWRLCNSSSHIQYCHQSIKTVFVIQYHYSHCGSKNSLIWSIIEMINRKLKNIFFWDFIDINIKVIILWYSYCINLERGEEDDYRILTQPCFTIWFQVKEYSFDLINWKCFIPITLFTDTKPICYPIFHFVFKNICPTFKTKVSFLHLISLY
jgi:hypothetical protein